jgi:hypothetical protein
MINPANQVTPSAFSICEPPEPQMLDYTEYSAVTLALVELRAQVADDITHTHLSAALKRLQSLRDDALLRAAALPVGLKRRDGDAIPNTARTEPPRDRSHRSGRWCADAVEGLSGLLWALAQD